VQLGREPARIASYKRYLAEHGRRSALFDTPRFTRELENAFERLALDARARQGA
jgi:predicted O-linked N-acetylglucosamine transferase (SPINDLY family)